MELPNLVTVTEAFSKRLPSQRVLDEISKVEPGGFGEIAQTQPFRLIAFRALLRDFPDYDISALWLHAYDVEVEVADVDPTLNGSRTPEPLSGATGG